MSALRSGHCWITEHHRCDRYITMTSRFTPVWCECTCHTTDKPVAV